MSGLSNRYLYGHGGSSASVSSAPQSTISVSPPSSPSSFATQSAVAQRGVLQNRSQKHHGSNHNTNPVTKVASKLNELVTQGLFGCGSPRGPQQADLLLEDGAAEVMPTGRQRPSLFQSDNDNKEDPDDDIDDGIEVDNENSLRPSYELYRV